MSVHVMARLVAALVYVPLVHFNRYTIQMSMPYFRFGHQRVGELRDVRSRPFQQYRFQTVLVMNPDMHGRDHNVVIGML